MHATQVRGDIANRKNSFFHNMGWGLGKTQRDTLLAGCYLQDIVLKRGSKAVTFNAVDGSHVFIDAPAVLRSNCVATRSPLDIAQSVVARVFTLANDPAAVEIFFDKADTTLYPPQRGQLRLERDATVTPPSVEVVLQLAKKYACEPKEFGTTSLYHLPYLADRSVNWKMLFSSKDTKALAFNLLATALHHAFVTKYSQRKMVLTRIYRSDGTTVNVIGGGASEPAQHLSVYGEADLQVFSAAKSTSDAGYPCLISTIDTDFLLMAACNVNFNPTVPVILDLKTSAVSLNKLAVAMGATDAERRMNVAFW